jgi:hypothetical protein
MKDLLKTLPIRLFLSLAVVYLLLNILIIFLERWQVRLNLQVEKSEAEVTRLSQGLTRQLLGEKEYDTILQFLVLRQLLANRFSPVDFFQKFGAVLPKGFNVDSFLVSFDNSTFEISGRVPNLLFGVRLIRYFEQQPAFSEVIGSIDIRGQETLISLKGKMNRDFFK